MAAGVVGTVWATGTWSDTVWETDTWAAADADAGKPTLQRTENVRLIITREEE